MKGDVKKEESESEGGAGTSEKAECKELSDMIDHEMGSVVRLELHTRTHLVLTADR